MRNTIISATLNFALGLVGFEVNPKAGRMAEAADAAVSTAPVIGKLVDEVEVDGEVLKTLTVSFQVNKDWSALNGQDQAVIKVLGGAFTDKSGAPFLSAWAVGINGDPRASVAGYALNGKAVINGQRTQVGFNAELGKGDFKVLSKAIKAAQAAGKQHLQILVTGVTEVFAGEGSKYYDPDLGGVFSVNPTKKGDKANVVLKSRLRVSAIQVVGEGDAGWVRLATERGAFDLTALLDSEVAGIVGHPISTSTRAQAAVTALKAGKGNSWAAAIARASEPLELVDIPEAPVTQPLADAADAMVIPEDYSPLEDGDSHLWG